MGILSDAGGGGVDLLTKWLSSPWFLGGTAVVAVLFVLALLWKILGSDEGFLFGYGNWVVGKWQKGRQAPGAPVAAPSTARERKGKASRREGGEATWAQTNENDLSALHQELALKTGVLGLSKALDADMASLMMREVEAWPEKVGRALQTLVSGVTRVVRPAGRCRAGFFALDEDDAYLVLWVGEGYVLGRKPRLAIENSCAGRAFITGANYYCKDIQSDPVYFQSAGGSEEYRSIACVPVQTSGQIFGVLCLDARQVNAFTQADFEHLEVFAAKLAVFLAFHSLQSGGGVALCGR
jgi:putative methionine-R-sulfoxide reductase with GAF domain